MEEVGEIRKSVAYKKSRLILKCLDEYPVAYARWFSGFVVIIKDHYGALSAYSYSSKRPFNKRKDCVFEPVILGVAIDFLKTNNNGIIEKEFDERNFENMKRRYEPLVLGSFEYKNKERGYNWDFGKIRIIRFKNGRLKTEKEWYKDGFYGVDLERVLEYFQSTDYKIENNTVPKEIIKEIKKNVMVDKL